MLDWILSSGQPLAGRVLPRVRPKRLLAACGLTRRSASSRQPLPPPLGHDASRKSASLGRDVMVSILESSPTRRDAKAYIKKYLDREEDPPTTTTPPLEPFSSTTATVSERDPRIAIVSLRRVQATDDAVLAGVAKTLGQLHALGLFCIIVVDCGPEASPFTLLDQAHRVARMVDELEAQRAQVLSGALHIPTPGSLPSTPEMMDPGPLVELMRKGVTPVVASSGIATNPHRLQSVNSNDVILAVGKAINRYGLQATTTSGPAQEAAGFASIERVIVLDPLGALPLEKRPSSCHRLVNLHQESQNIIAWLDKSDKPQHAENMRLARDALGAFPLMPSVLITSPSAAAHRSAPAEHMEGREITSAVRTRVAQNPLIHNLLTDKPIYSSSLPVQRLYAGGVGNPRQGEEPIRATLVKRGLPLTIYPDPRLKPWTPSTSASTSTADRPRLTDAQIDLERLTHLINDSFGRRLNVQHYMDRVNQNLAGIVVAGNYEGCAILTWETSLDPTSGRRTMVPYLDKFAVLRRSQGNSGVADFLFNTLVLDCFPDGLCWRSRKTNPVNKWYFERSTGFLDLDGTGWTMFWTRSDVGCGSAILQDYERACRSIEPSWEPNEPSTTP